MKISFYKIIKPSTSIEVFGLFRVFTYIILVAGQSRGSSLLTESSGEGFMDSYRPNMCTESEKIKNVLEEHQVDLFAWDNGSYY